MKDTVEQLSTDAFALLRAFKADLNNGHLIDGPGRVGVASAALMNIENLFDRVKGMPK